MKDYYIENHLAITTSLQTRIAFEMWKNM